MHLSCPAYLPQAPSLSFFTIWSPD
jgi:hypothetical protein